jgi:hypothetical protein
VSDPTLLLFGVGVTFIFVAGVYVYVRERYERVPQGAQSPSERAQMALRDARSET